MTAFSNVAQVNKAFGNPKGKPVVTDRLVSQCENIKDEFDELLLALGRRDVTKVRDGLCDIMVFAYGALHFLGVNGDRDMKAVTDSLFSRLCQDQADLDATVAKYEALGLEVYTEGKFPTACVKCAKDFTDAGGNQYRKGKFLKSVSYTEPVFLDAPLKGRMPKDIISDETAAALLARVTELAAA